MADRGLRSHVTLAAYCVRDSVGSLASLSSCFLGCIFRTKLFGCIQLCKGIPGHLGSLSSKQMQWSLTTEKLWTVVQTVFKPGTKAADLANVTQ